MGAIRRPSKPVVVRVLVIVCALTAGPGCWLFGSGPSESVAGRWRATGIGHTGYEMSLQQEGDNVRGVAYAISVGTMYFKNVPVSGEYPDVRFTVTAETVDPCCAHSLVGQQFNGEIKDDGDIVGPSSFGSDLRFKRSSGPFYCLER